eukprot:COSAG02_NODE_2133_length_9721_cov_11.017044_9_plen_57_part_00
MVLAHHHIADHASLGAPLDAAPVVQCRHVSELSSPLLARGEKVVALSVAPLPLPHQ